MMESSLADSWGGVLALFLLFCYVLAGALGYGARVSRALLPRQPLLHLLGDSFLFSSLLLWASATFLASVHGLAWFSRWFYWLIFLPGAWYIAPLARASFAAAWKRRRSAFLLCLIVFSVRGLSAVQPGRNGDPLLYHILGPRLWAEAGGFIMHPQLPTALLAASWECIYLWPQLLWRSASPFYGLVEAQIFSQWFHLFLAWGGCGLLLMRIFRGSVREAWLPLLAWAGLFVFGLQGIVALAKNDLGVVLWTLGSVAFLSEGLPGNVTKKIFLSGIFAGLAITGKITALVSLVPLLGIVFWQGRDRKKASRTPVAAGIWIAGFVAGAFPIYMRNFLLSGNPVFPLYPNLFPSPWMSRSWTAFFAQVQPASSTSTLIRPFVRIPNLVHETPWIVGAMAVLALAFFAPRKGRVRELVNSNRVGLLVGALLAYGVFTLTQGPEIELRYLGASLMLLAAGGISLFLGFAEWLPKEKHRQMAGYLVLVIVLASSRLPLHIVRKIWKEPLGVAFTRTHSAGEAKAWLRENANGILTILAGDNEVYYLTPIPVTILTERPDLDAAVEKTTLAPFVRTLCELTRGRYLLDARPQFGVERKFGATDLAPGLVFSAQGANIYDLQKLEKRLSPGPYHCQSKL